MPKDRLCADDYRALAVEYAWSFIGTPYLWGGDDPILGFDCSGFVIHVLQAVGRLAQKQDYTADALLGLFKPNRVATPGKGCLAFWLNAQCRARHVEICINGELSIGASGGGSATVSTEAAASANAFIQMKPLWGRGSTPVFVDPWLELQP